MTEGDTSRDELLEIPDSGTTDVLLQSSPNHDTTQHLLGRIHTNTTTTSNDNFVHDNIVPPEIARHATSLACAPTTSWLAFFLIPVLIVLTHILFLYGQTTNMWHLTAQWEATVSYVAESTKAKMAFSVMKLPTSNTYNIPLTIQDIRQYTYGHAIYDLWDAKGMPGVILPRIAAIGLVLFSGVWPHLKLFMLLLTWCFARHPIRRRRALASLSILGKWSLVDVVVVCVLIGVVNLQWDFTSEIVMQGIQKNLSVVVGLIESRYSSKELCGLALKYECINPKKFQHIIDCRACQTTVDSLYEHPESAEMILSGISTSGGGHAQLSVAGLNGIYYFCGAVIMSIFLSIVVDWYDHKSRLAIDNQREALHTIGNEEMTIQVTNPEISGTLAVDEGGLDDGATTASNDVLQQLLLVENGKKKESRSQADLDFDRRIMLESQQQGNRLMQGLSLGTIFTCMVATLCVTIERRVHGAIPSLLNNILGVVWTKHYNFWTLAWTTGLAGGWDWMLMGSFALFTILGPILRSILCFQASRTNETADMPPSVAAAVRRRIQKLSLAIDFVGSFCAWEVYTVALCMVGLLLPGITGTILRDSRCSKLGQNTSTCFEVEYDLKASFAWVVVGGFLLVAVSSRIRRNQPPY